MVICILRFAKVPRAPRVERAPIIESGEAVLDVTNVVSDGKRTRHNVEHARRFSNQDLFAFESGGKKD